MTAYPKDMHRRVKHAISWRLSAVKWGALSQKALAQTNIRWLLRRPGPTHDLPAELIVSLTSYKPRFKVLLPTLRCLLTQTVRADRTILWIADHETELPTEVTSLQKHGLEIRFTTDHKSYKKIIPTLKEFPNAFIVTADDDVYYGSRWLETLVRGWDGKANQVVCHAARLIRGDEKTLLPYHQWPYIQEPSQSNLVFPVGVGGVLYPPSSLPPETTSAETFLSLCPGADDVWLYWMGRRNSNLNKKIGRGDVPVNMPGSQAVSLFEENVRRGGNDLQIRTMAAEFGNPLT
jgi:hypothetical protein